MSESTPTNAQLRLLRAVARCSSPDSPADGWDEVYTHFDESNGTPSALAMANFDRIGDACEKRGWITVEPEASIALTDAGRTLIAKASP
jgi:hypothetical protein